MTKYSVPSDLSRRDFIRGAAIAALTTSASARAQTKAKHLSSVRILAYVGTYTGAVGAGSNGEGIYLYDFDPQTGELLHGKLVATTPNPSWIAIHPTRKFLYAIHEVADYEGQSGSVSAFSIDPATGGLTALNTVSSQGAGPAYLSLDATGKFAFVANYGGGTIAVLPILADGRLGPAVDVRRDESSLGSTHAASAPPGSFAISGHDAPHAHIILPDPQNRFVLSTDLGQDRIYTYRFDSATGKLAPSDASNFTVLPSGDGPRHLAFHPNGRWLYSIQEESSTLVFFHYDPFTGKLAAQQTVSTLPSGFAGTSFASEVLVSHDGRNLYAANRLHDTIAVFAIEANGTLRPLGEASTEGDYPAQCRIDPTGCFLLVCNRRSDCITSFRIQRPTGRLTFTGRYTPVGSPGSITFLKQA